MKEKITFTIVLLIMACLLVSPVFADEVPGTAPAIVAMKMSNSVDYPVTPHSIVPEVSETGKISVSIDAVGQNTGSGTIIIEKPAGATVRSAYMAAASTGFTSYKLVPGDVTIDGTPVTWDIADYPNHIRSYNYFTDVTSIVKSKIDSAPAGEVSFTVAEAHASSIDGEILAVIFDDPTQTTDNTVVLLFGAQDTDGDIFNIGLADPLDTADPDLNLDFSLGISFGHQPNAQYSQIDVNGRRLTTSAGGEDDGAPTNGALITVGGVGDTNANPANPYQTDSAGPRYDDELYSLLPFVADGDTLIVVNTLNPSDDDNIFFAALNLKSATAVVGKGIVLSPASATNQLGEMHTLTAKVLDDLGNPVPGVAVDFMITEGPNAGLSAYGITDTAGQVTFSYTSAVEGTDSIIARVIENELIVSESNIATKTWVREIPPVPEFPALVLPVTMLFGVLFLVHIVKGRKA